jgi:uncharacterized hydantoinase/oxoprolinase family protein
MTKESHKREKAVQKIKKAVRKAVDKGVSQAVVEGTVELAMTKASGKKVAASSVKAKVAKLAKDQKKSLPGKKKPPTLTPKTGRPS